jgi:hypothetical protein
LGKTKERIDEQWGDDQQAHIFGVKGRPQETKPDRRLKEEGGRRSVYARRR